MVSSEDLYKPVVSAGCLGLVAKIVVLCLIIAIFGLGLFAGIFMSTVASALI